MSERLRKPVWAAAARAGGVDFGPVTLVLEDDALTVLPESPAANAIRITLAHVTAVNGASGTLDITLRDGRVASVACDDAESLRDELLARCRDLPELTRTLRAFGSRRRQHGSRDTAAAEQQQYFAPLLAARVEAIRAGNPTATVVAFDARRLGAELHRTLRTLVATRHSEPGAARRALEAELVDLSEPLDVALVALGEAARELQRDADDLRVWRTWSDRLVATFEIADRVWIALDAALDTPSWHP